jgi:hypothetical protein
MDRLIFQPLQETEGGRELDNSREQIHASADRDGRQRGYGFVEFLIQVCIIGALVVLVVVPSYLKYRRDKNSPYVCNGLLDAIVTVKERLAYKAGIGPGSATIPLDVDLVNSYLRRTDVRDPCPGGGTYIIGDINAPDGTTIIPVCTHGNADAGRAITFRQIGLHIHRRSFVLGASGEYHRRAELTFADEVEQMEKDAK